tara:strand:+ start:690 stop:821 length:132 start_codon:yes stop_codon:yes gene_type:complete
LLFPKLPLALSIKQNLTPEPNYSKKLLFPLKKRKALKTLKAPT